MAPVYSLYYFDALGRAETTRIMLAYAGVEFEDVKFAFPEWQKLKPDKKRFPLGSLPVLLVHATGQNVIESMAIVRFVAREHGLYGSGNAEANLVDIGLEVTSGIRDHFFNVLRSKSDEEKKTRLEEIPEKSKPALEYLEEIAKNNSDGFVIGKSVTAVDLTLAALKDHAIKYAPNLFGPYPALSAVIKKVRESPNVKKYLDARSPPPF